MAKDGTYRGGRRIRAGCKPDSAADKIKSGKTPRIMNNDIPELEADELEAVDLPDGAVLEGADMPKPGEYLSARQKNGKPLGAGAMLPRRKRMPVPECCCGHSNGRGRCSASRRARTA